MPEQTTTPTPKIRKFLNKAAASTRLNLWKFVGALIMEEKNGVQAVSLTKLLSLSTYAACMWLWLGFAGGEIAPEVKAALDAAKVDVPKALQGASVVPDAMLYTLWALLGINGTSKVAGILKGGGDAGASDGQQTS